MNNMIVGSIRTTVNPPLTSGIYEALMEKAERERDEAREDAANLRRMSVVELMSENLNVKHHVTEWENRCLKAERERDEARKSELAAISERERWRMQAEEKWGMRRELEELLGVKDTQSDKQFAKGLAALRVLIQERDHYKQAIEEISVTIQDWLDSIVQEPSLDFIKAIKAWADKKLNNG